MSRNAVILAVICLVKFSEGWVLTEVKFPDRDSNSLRDMEDELSPHEIELLMAQGRFSLTYTGTKWCGPGNTADGYDDLGSEVEADRCCRDHDHCPDIIPGGETKHNLTNTSFYTRLHCDCDEEFRQCLRNAHTQTANRIGLIYFDGIKTMCFRKDYPVTGCEKKSGWLIRKCIKYTYNLNGEKYHQWFDVPNY